VNEVDLIISSVIIVYQLTALSYGDGRYLHTFFSVFSTVSSVLLSVNKTLAV